MKNFVYPEMMVHVPLCTHKDPRKVLVVSDDAGALLEEIGRHHGVEADVIAASSALEGLRDLADGAYDVVLSEAGGDAATLAHCGRVLGDEGLLAMCHPALGEEAANTVLMQTLGHAFKIIMPYRLENGETLLLASKAYHPTADVILQRTDLIEGQRYYNCDIHVGAFAMPNYVRSAYLGVIRN